MVCMCKSYRSKFRYDTVYTTCAWRIWKHRVFVCLLVSLGLSDSQNTACTINIYGWCLPVAGWSQCLCVYSATSMRRYAKDSQINQSLLASIPPRTRPGIQFVRQLYPYVQNYAVDFALTGTLLGALLNPKYFAILVQHTSNQVTRLYPGVKVGRKRNYHWYQRFGNLFVCEKEGIKFGTLHF